jgi:alanyl-tRNA synthetase
MITPTQIRTKYLQFFEKNGHAIIPSAPMVPENDPTTLFTGSGMQPMITYLLGEPHPKGKRIADSQKCFRSQDIEEVGDNRHTTFFEMLGNWSLGDYFKKEQLRWFFTFLTDEVGLAPEKLFVTVFRGNDDLGIPKDTESVAIWKELFAEKGIDAKDVDFADRDGMQGGRIFYYEEKKNWWSRAGEPKKMPAGEPGGPDSEMFYDFGVELKLHESSIWKDEPCHVNCDCGRFLEIGNSVFMQYQKQADGSFVELPQRNVDFGGGLERIAAAANGDSDVFKTDLFQPVISHLEKISAKSYSNNEETTRSFRVIADHMRAAVMLASDGVFPSNKEQGYFARRLVRRSIRYGKMIGIERAFLAELVPIIAQIYKDAYPAVLEQQEKIAQVLSQEEQKFAKSIEKGLKEIERIKVTSTSAKPELTVDAAFNLYETYGYPVELSVEIAQEKGLQLVPAETFLEEFQKRRQQHAESSRTASAGKFKGGLQDQSVETVKFHTATHLLHAALRKILGTHVQQKGSNITAERLRFDFSHPAAVTPQELEKVLAQINEWIEQDLTVTRQVMQKEKALESGAIAFFIEKYPDEVSVYTIGTDSEKDWISKEFCGGPHVEHTAQIGKLKLKKEEAVSAGVRRIYLQFV